MGDLLTTLGGAASGGIVGLAAPLLTASFNLFKGHLEHKRSMELIKLQSEAKNAEAASAIAVAREQGAAAAFTSAIQAEGGLAGESQWVRDIRGANRPVLTWAGLIISAICAACGIVNELTIALNAYTGMMIGFWFGQRALDKSTLTWSSGKIAGQVTSKTTK